MKSRFKSLDKYNGESVTFCLHHWNSSHNLAASCSNTTHESHKGNSSPSQDMGQTKHAGLCSRPSWADHHKQRHFKLVTKSLIPFKVISLDVSGNALATTGCGNSANERRRLQHGPQMARAVYSNNDTRSTDKDPFCMSERIKPILSPFITSTSKQESWCTIALCFSLALIYYFFNNVLWQTVCCCKGCTASDVPQVACSDLATATLFVCTLKFPPNTLSPSASKRKGAGSTSRFGSPFSSRLLWFMDTVSWLCPAQILIKQ